MQKLAIFCLLFLSSLSLSRLAIAQVGSTKEASKPPARIEAITSQIVDDLWIQSDHYWHDGDYNRIIALVRVCVEADPNFSEGYSSAAYLLWSLGDVKGADEFLLNGIQKCKDDQGKSSLYFEIGSHYTRTKRDSEAISPLEKALSMGDKEYICYSTLANCYRRLKMYPKSLKIWELAIKQHPEMASAVVNRDRVKKLIAESDKSS